MIIKKKPSCGLYTYSRLYMSWQLDNIKQPSHNQCHCKFHHSHNTSRIWWYWACVISLFTTSCLIYLYIQCAHIHMIYIYICIQIFIYTELRWLLVFIIQITCVSSNIKWVGCFLRSNAGSLKVCLMSALLIEYTYIYIYMYAYVCMYIYIYAYYILYICIYYIYMYIYIWE